MLLNPTIQSFSSIRVVSPHMHMGMKGGGRIPAATVPVMVRVLTARSLPNMDMVPTLVMTGPSKYRPVKLAVWPPTFTVIVLSREATQGVAQKNVHPMVK